MNATTRQLGQGPGKPRFGASYAAISLVGAGENGAFCGRLGARDAAPRYAFLLEGDAAHGGAGLFLDFGFAVATAAPGGQGKAGFDRAL